MAVLTRRVWRAVLLLALAAVVFARDPPPPPPQQPQQQQPPQQPQQHQQDVRCVTPTGQESACVKLTACRLLLDLLRQGRMDVGVAEKPLPPIDMRRAQAQGRAGLVDPEATAILRKSHCGFQGSTVMVCCPPNDLQTRAKPSTEDQDLGAAVSFSGPSAYPGHLEPHGASSSAAFGATPDSQGLDAGVGYGHAPTFTSTTQASQDRIPASFSITAAQPETLDSKNLALLPMEICGLSSNSHDESLTAQIQHPWMARLGYRQADGSMEYFCSGSLISERYVLTAAHCIGVLNGPSTVRLGQQDVDAAGTDCFGSTCAFNVTDVNIEEGLIHEGYSRGRNDIALIRLVHPVTFTKAVRPICLPVPVQDKPAENLVGKTLIVSSWGKSAPNRRFHAPSRTLQQTRVTVEDASGCLAAYNGADDVEFSVDGHLCVGGLSSSCQGDSGSPLMLSEPRRGPGPPRLDTRAVLQGLLSYGLADCVLRSAPVVYTRVANYLPWIVSRLQPAPFVPKDKTSGSGVVDPRQGSESGPRR